MSEVISMWSRPERGETDWQATAYSVGYGNVELELGYITDKDGDMHFYADEEELANFLVDCLNEKYAGLGLNIQKPVDDTWCDAGQWYDATATSGDGFATFYTVDCLIRCLAFDITEQGDIEDATKKLPWQEEQGLREYWEKELTGILSADGGDSVIVWLVKREG